MNATPPEPLDDAGRHAHLTERVRLLREHTFANGWPSGPPPATVVCIDDHASQLPDVVTCVRALSEFGRVEPWALGDKRFFYIRPRLVVIGALPLTFDSFFDGVYTLTALFRGYVEIAVRAPAHELGVLEAALHANVGSAANFSVIGLSASGLYIREWVAEDRADWQIEAEGAVTGPMPEGWVADGYRLVRLTDPRVVEAVREANHEAAEGR